MYEKISQHARVDGTSWNARDQKSGAASYRSTWAKHSPTSALEQAVGVNQHFGVPGEKQSIRFEMKSDTLCDLTLSGRIQVDHYITAEVGIERLPRQDGSFGRQIEGLKLNQSFELWFALSWGLIDRVKILCEYRRLEMKKLSFRIDALLGIAQGVSINVGCQDEGLLAIQ